jgi:DNA-binding MarR family transcriptional regulator
MLGIRDIPSIAEFRRLKKLIPEIPPEHASLAIRLGSTTSRLFERLDAYLARDGLSFGRVAVMLQLMRYRSTGLTPSELADKIGVTRATITGLLDRLAREGFVERAEHPSDRRSHVVHLTTSGFAKLAWVLPRHAGRVRTLLKTITAEERKVLVRVVAKIESALETLPEP